MTWEYFFILESLDIYNLNDGFERSFVRERAHGRSRFKSLRWVRLLLKADDRFLPPRTKSALVKFPRRLKQRAPRTTNDPNLI